MPQGSPCFVWPRHENRGMAGDCCHTPVSVALWGRVGLLAASMPLGECHWERGQMARRVCTRNKKRPAEGLRRGADFVVGVTRFELVTSSVSGKRSPPELNARSSGARFSARSNIPKTNTPCNPKSQIFLPTAKKFEKPQVTDARHERTHADRGCTSGAPATRLAPRDARPRGTP